MPTERSFGLSVGTVCTAAAALGWWRGHDVLAVVLVGVGAALLVGGVAVPSALRVPNRIWWRFAQVLGWINARILLTVLFIVVLTPIGVIMRLCGRSPLRRTRGATNWSPYPASRRATDHYQRLF